MKIEVKEVSNDNLDDILALRVNDDQRGYIESVRECLADALECKFYEPAGLYVDDLVGFVMFGLFPYEGREGRVWLDRFLIDKKYQGKGYEMISLKFMIEYLVERYSISKIYLSLFQDNTHALSMYKSIGFVFNGEIDLKGEKVMCLDIR